MSMEIENLLDKMRGPEEVVEAYYDRIRPRLLSLMEKGGTEDVEPLMRKVVQKLAEAADFFQGIDEVDDALVDAIDLHVQLLERTEKVPEDIVDFVVSLADSMEGSTEDMITDGYYDIFVRPELFERVEKALLARGWDWELRDLYADTGNYEKLKALIGYPEKPSDYEYIIRALKTAGRYKEAVEWVKRGLETHPSSMDLWLEGVKLYLELGDMQKAKDMIERSLSQKPSPSYLERLMGIAEKHGLLDDNLQRALLQYARNMNPLRDRIRVLLRLEDYEGLKEILPDFVTQASEEINHTYDLLIKALDTVGGVEPEFAYRTVASSSLLDDVVRHAQRRYYKLAANLLHGMKKWAEASGHLKDFHTLLETLKERHREKRAFLKMLEEMGL